MCTSKERMKAVMFTRIYWQQGQHTGMLEMVEGTTAYEAANAMMIITFRNFVCLALSVVHSQTGLVNCSASWYHTKG